jgi:hypothetical protein
MFKSSQKNFFCDVFLLFIQKLKIFKYILITLFELNKLFKSVAKKSFFL